MKKCKNRVGRPSKILTQKDKATIEAMCMKQCTCTEICAELGIDPKTLQKNLRMLYRKDPQVRKPITYSTVFEAYRQKGLTQLRQVMYDSAIKGNIPMLIFLAKNWLGMSDKPVPIPDTSASDAFLKAFSASVKEAGKQVCKEDFEVIPNPPPTVKQNTPVGSQ